MISWLLDHWIAVTLSLVYVGVYPFMGRRLALWCYAEGCPGSWRNYTIAANEDKLTKYAAIGMLMALGWPAIVVVIGSYRLTCRPAVAALVARNNAVRGLEDARRGDLAYRLRQGLGPPTTEEITDGKE